MYLANKLLSSVGQVSGCFVFKQRRLIFGIKIIERHEMVLLATRVAVPLGGYAVHAIQIIKHKNSFVYSSPPEEGG
jgi:hypothetical protein